MRRGMLTALALSIVCGLAVGDALAGPGCGGDQKTEANKTASCASSSEASAFPTMVMMVGEKTYHCPLAAQQAADRAEAKIIYAVGTEKFDNKDKALEALAAASESYTEKFLSIGCITDGKVVYCCDKTTSGEKTAAGHTCGAKAKTGTEGGESGGSAKTVSTEGKGPTCRSHGAATAGEDKVVWDKSKCSKFVVAGRTFNSWEDAVKARDAAREAAEQVKLAYLVDGKTVDSGEKVCPKAKAAGKVQFIVNEEKTDSEPNARVLLAKAKCAAAEGALKNEQTAKL
jgi:hypothetical protein